MEYNYTLLVDEAGDDKVRNLKPSDPNGNSEWLCIGGYLVRSGDERLLDTRRNDLVKSIGGIAGQALHFRKYKRKNRLLICDKLSTYPARAFVVCSFKETMSGYRNPRAEAAATSLSQEQYLYNFVVRLLLERVTEFVSEDANRNRIAPAKIRIVMASRKGHHFGHFKAYVYQLINQAKSNRTFLNTREIKADHLSYSLIERAPASTMAGLQLADVVVSSVFQSIERASPNFTDKPAKRLRRLFAARKSKNGRNSRRNGFGLTFYPKEAALRIDTEQEAFFKFFDYDFVWLRKQIAATRTEK